MVHCHRFLLAQSLWTVLLLAGNTNRLPAQEQVLGSVSADDQSQAKTAEVVSLPEITGKTMPTAELQAPGLEQLLNHLEAFRKAHTPFHIRHREVIKLRNASEVKAIESMDLPPGMLLDTEYESAFWDNRSWKRCLSRGVDGEAASDKRSSGDCEGTAGLDVPFALLGVFIEPKLENCKLTFDDIFPHITITADQHKDRIELWMFPVSGQWIPKRLRSTPEDKEEPVLEWEVNHVQSYGKDRPPQIIDGEVRFTVRNGDEETTITSEFFITKALYGDDVVPREIDASLAPIPAPPAVAPVVEAPVINTPAASNGPQLRAQSPTVIVIETTPDIDRSEVIRKVVEALEKDGRAKRGDIERVGKPVGQEAILSPVHDMSHEKIIKFIEVLQSLGVDRMRFSANNEQKESTVIIQCPPDIAWRKVRTMTEELEKTGDFKVDVRVAASDEPVTPVAAESLPNANRVTTILPGAEELPPPSNLQDGASLFPSRPALETSERGEVKVFALQNIQAIEAGRIIEQLYIMMPGGHDSFPIRLSVDDRNNSLIVRGDSAVIAEVEALLLRLDTKQSEPNPADSSNAIGGDDAGIRVNVPALGPEPLALDFSVPVSSAQGQTFSFSIGVSGQNADDLRQQNDALEQRARSLSEQLRKPLPDPATGETLRSQLRDTVRQAFETRQNLQRAELAEFAQRLKGIQESIELRDKVSQQIIDRRFEELLDPNLKWDEPVTNSGRAQALRSDSLPSSNDKATPDGSRRAATIPTPHLQHDVSPRTPTQDEKAISKLVLTFFQDRSRRAVPCVVVKINGEFFAVTTSPATVVPDGTVHAIDRSVVEWSDGSKATVTCDERSTRELQLYRFADDAVIPEPQRSAAEIMINAIPTVGIETSLEIGVPLSALTPVGSPSLSETRVRVSAINVSQKLTLPSHKVEHQYEGLFAVDAALPEGTPIFLDGKLMGLTILGSRFVGEEARQSYVFPANRLWEFCNKVP